MKNLLMSIIILFTTVSCATLNEKNDTTLNNPPKLSITIPKIEQKTLFKDYNIVNVDGMTCFEDTRTLEGHIKNNANIKYYVDQQQQTINYLITILKKEGYDVKLQ